MGIGDEEDDDEDDKAVWQVDEWWWLWWCRWRRWGLQNYVTSWLLREAHRAEVDRAKEVEQQLAEAYRSLQNIIIMMESRSCRWSTDRSLQTIIIMMESVWLRVMINIVAGDKMIKKPWNLRERVEMARKCLEKEEEVDRYILSCSMNNIHPNMRTIQLHFLYVLMMRRRRLTRIVWII